MNSFSKNEETSGTILYFDCHMGIAGDMILGALLDLLEAKEQNAFIEKMESMGIPEIQISYEKVVRGDVPGMLVHVRLQDDEKKNNRESMRRTLTDIHGIIDNLCASGEIKRQAKAIYDIIAEAESTVHGHPIERTHFHEVGALDAVVDVIGVCLLMEELSLERVIASPIHVGNGTVKCAHGVLPVPAPATAAILEDIPTYSGDIQDELCTPTGAALVRYFADTFGDMPKMAVMKSGRGFGTKVFPDKINGLTVTIME